LSGGGKRGILTASDSLDKVASVATYVGYILRIAVTYRLIDMAAFFECKFEIDFLSLVLHLWTSNQVEQFRSAAQVTNTL